MPVTPQNATGISQLLVANQLQVQGNDGTFTIVEDVDLVIPRGRTLGIVGESGSGKTTVAMGLLGFSREGTRISSGTVFLNGENILSLSPIDLRARRGRDISYVPQDPSTGLHPGIRIGAALREMLGVHSNNVEDIDARVEQVLRETQLPTDAEFQRRYPFELSGGQQQRVAIALALVCRPSVIIMDEPTTGLDVTTQARLIEVIRDLVRVNGTSLVYVSHDLGVVRSLADDVAVMYGGRIVEQGPVDEVFTNPMHPYTRGLLEAVPRALTKAFKPRAIAGDAVEPWDWPTGCPFAPRCSHHSAECDVSMPAAVWPEDSHMLRCINFEKALLQKTTLEPVERKFDQETDDSDKEIVLTVNNLHANYNRSKLLKGKKSNDAVNDVSFNVETGSCLAIVGESGSGKSTTLRCIAGLHEPRLGLMEFKGEVLEGRSRQRHGDIRRLIQIVPQNPDSSLNPKMTVGEIIERPLALYSRVPKKARHQRVLELLELVHLRPAMGARYASELSGGEKQRVAIARALAAEPSLLLCDEVVSALDVAVQAGILELLEELRNDLGMTLVFVTHDLGVVRSIASQVVVMKNGQVVETGTTKEIFENPRDTYTQELLGAIPHLRPTDYPGAPE
jgi:peptide/nickel transport system ATP-binding protein